MLFTISDNLPNSKPLKMTLNQTKNFIKTLKKQKSLIKVESRPKRDQTLKGFNSKWVFQFDAGQGYIRTLELYIAKA